MARWILEPGHTSAEFSARHMMVTWVRGHFKDVHGTLEFDPDDPLKSTVEVEIDASKIWSGGRLAKIPFGPGCTSAKRRFP